MRRSWLLCFWPVAVMAQQPAAVSDAQAGIYQPRPLTVEGINQQTEILRNPQIALDNARNVLSQSAQKAMDAPSPVPLPQVAQDKMNDPTIMTGSFTQALGRINGKGGVNNAVPPLPELQLVARSIRGNQKTAMISGGGKTHMLREGGRFSIILPNKHYEIVVNRIDHDFVEVLVLPESKTVILQ